MFLLSPRGVAAPGVWTSEPPPADQRSAMFFVPWVSKGLLELREEVSKDLKMIEGVVDHGEQANR